MSRTTKTTTTKTRRKSAWETKIKPFVDNGKIQQMAWTMTEQQICDHLGVSLTTTWYKAKKEHPELVEALAAGRQQLCTDIRGAMIKRAQGYSYTEVKTTRRWTEMPDEVRAELLGLVVSEENIDRVVQVKEETTEKYQAPDVKAADLLLRNYSGAGEWHSGDIDAHELAAKKLDWEKEKFDRTEEF